MWIKWSIKSQCSDFKACKEAFKTTKAEKNCILGLYLFMSSIHIKQLIKNKKILVNEIRLCWLQKMLKSVQKKNKLISSHNELKRGKNVHFGRTMHCLPQRLKSTIFEIFHSLRVPFGNPPLENISKMLIFSLWGKQCIVLPKWTFSRVLAHCV